MHLFVTGASSFIGKAVLAACDARSIRVTGIDLQPPTRPDCSMVDINTPAIADAIPEDIDAVIHLAAVSRDSDSQGRAAHCFSVNVLGTLNLIEAAHTRGAGQFVFASSEWVYGSEDSVAERHEDDPINAALMTSEYALSKYVSEANLRQAYNRWAIPTAALRFGIVYGPRTKNWSAVEALLDSVARKDEITVGALKTARRYIHVEDVAEGILASVGLRGFEIINIQGPRLVSLGDVIASSSSLLGRAPRITESAPETPSIRRVSDEKAQDLLGWRAKIDIDAGLMSLLPALGLKAADGMT